MAQDYEKLQELLRKAEAELQEAEARAKKAEALIAPRTLFEYLEAYHSISLSMKITKDLTLTTQGDVTKPAGRLYPQRIIPWDAFPDEQEDVWAELSASPTFMFNQAFPSRAETDFVKKRLDPIDCEIQLRAFARDAVEDPVKTVIKQVYEDEDLRKKLRLRGGVTFDSHTNLGLSGVTIDMRAMSIGDAPTQPANTEGGIQGKPKGGGRADQFCIHRQQDGPNLTVAAIEYKPPHKLRREDIVAGLRGEIMPARDVIGKEHDSAESSMKHLLAAVVTQCFSYMVHKCVQYGYVYTGDAFVFLYIPDDPTVVHYSVCIPSLDVDDEDEDRLHRTAVGQVTIFILRALAAESPTQAWHQARGALLAWDVEYIDILKDIPETVRKTTRETFSYRPPRWKRTPVRPRRQIRAQCLPADDRDGVQPGEDDDSDSSIPPSPTPGPTTRSKAQALRQQAKQPSSADKSKIQATTKTLVGDQPYCTHACLLGLLRSGPLDQQCPNIQAHNPEHIKPQAFLYLIQRQLAADLGADADCKPLYIRGSRGALFKVRLSSHGYTLVAKGMREDDGQHIRHEHRMYQHVLAAQGTAVPVCVGLVKLRLPYFYDAAEYTRMLFLSWAGRPLFHFVNKDNAVTLKAEATAKLRELHALGLLHRDAEMRNVLWDERTGGVMWADLERAEARTRQPLSLVSPNRRQKGPAAAKKAGGSPDVFSRELVFLSAHIDRFFLRL